MTKSKTTYPSTFSILYFFYLLPLVCTTSFTDCLSALSPRFSSFLSLSRILHLRCVSATPTTFCHVFCRSGRKHHRNLHTSFQAHLTFGARLHRHHISRYWSLRWLTICLLCHCRFWILLSCLKNALSLLTRSQRLDSSLYYQPHLSLVTSAQPKMTS